MTIVGWVQIALFSVIVILITRPLGGYMTRVFAGERTFLSPVLRPVERAVYWCCGVDEKEEQHWLTYAIAMLFFSVVGFVTLYALQRLQWYLPFNPQGQTGVEPSSALNTSVSFITNTNWQSYVPETTMGYLVQMAGLTVHNFLSAATGIALALALIKGFVRREARTIGNFWVDLTRTTLYVLLPLSVVIALFYVWQGVPQNLGPYIDATTLEGAKQTIAQGPVASQEAIKILGTNGGGFLNANSAHPYENPNPVNMQLGEVIFGGVGSGLYGILAFAIVAMFVAGLMVGRTPEYLGKKLEAKEVKMTILALLSLPLSILGWTALATVVPAGLAGIANGGPHGFTEILYAYTEGTANNGSAFAGLSANTLFYNTTIAAAMLIGRFIFVIPLLAVAGSLAQKKLLAPSAGTFPTNRPLFVGLLMGVILIMGGLTYFPAVSLGPAVEQVAMNQGKLFPGP